MFILFLCDDGVRCLQRLSTLKISQLNCLSIVSAALRLVEEERRQLDQRPPVPHRHRLHDQRHPGVAPTKDETLLLNGRGCKTGL